MATDKQIQANQSNSLKSTGPSTEEGKGVSKFNALKHGILKSEMSEYEAADIEEVKGELENDLKPNSTIERYILERIAVHLVKLKRINKAEKEFIQSVLHPELTFPKIGGKGTYYPKINGRDVEALLNIYQRYETTEENRMYKALEKFKDLKSQN